MSSDKAITILEQIGKYRITGELGRGGMGIVFRGEDPLIGRQVAIKTLTEVTPELRERFYLEARTGILNHPNIVTIYELGEHEGTPFIAMEFIGGESLEKTLRRQHHLPVLDALCIVEQLCAGLGHAHEHGVVHRDVKPANVLVQPDGQVKVVDFGIARLADQTQQLTKTDALLGTFHYIAPERLKGEPNDGRGDIWSIGVILYEMLTGELPFKGKDVSSLYRVIHEPFVPLSEYVRDLPEGLGAVLDRALAKRAEDRYATAEEMLIDLQGITSTFKHDRMNALLQTARRLAEERQFASARTILLQAQHVDPGNTEAKVLMIDVQDRLSSLKREEQLHQILEQAHNAEAERRWEDAIASLQQAQKLDTENTFQIEERLRRADEQRRQQQRISALWEQASEARNRGDLNGAQEYLGEALRLDEHSTDLRNAYAMVLREIRRGQQERQVGELLRSAREDYGNRRYTGAIVRLREAAAIDPANAEVQELLFTAAARQKEERKQAVVEKLAAEIQESLDREDFTQAQDRIMRALETLPGEASLLRLKTETESRKRDFETQEVVRSVMSQVQELFAEHAEEALQAIHKGLEQVPDNETLLQARARLQERLRNLQRDAACADALLKAHAAMDDANYPEAVRVLEEATRAHGANEDLASLLTAVREQLKKEQRKAAEQRDAAEKDAALKEAVGAFEQALAVGNYARCMRPLDDLAKRWGEGVVAIVRQECETKLRTAAEQSLDAAMTAARQPFHRGSLKEALVIVRQAEKASPYAGSSKQIDFERFKKELQAESRQKGVKKTGGKRPRVWFGAGVGLMAAAALVGSLLIRTRTPAPAQKSAVPAAVIAVPRTYMEINASPWARILRVQDSRGKDVLAPGADQATPLRLDQVAEGSYKVDLVGPDGRNHSLDCNVSATEHQCSAEIEPTDIQRVLDGGSR